MQADFEFEMKLNGTQEELVAMLSVMRSYANGEKPAYFSFTEAVRGGARIDLEDADEDEILEFLSNNEGAVEITASGPYGHYGVLNDVDVFRDMAEIAPEAEFTGEISGSRTYSEESLNCKLENKILYISSYYEDNNEGPNEYVEYFTSKVPYKKFLKLFKISEDDFDEDAYEEFIDFSLREECITDMEYDTFMEALETESTLSEEDYDLVMEKLREIPIESYDDFADDSDFGSEEEFQYDPVSRKYLNRTAPVLKCNQAYDEKEIIKLYLEQKGLSCDDESIEKMSLSPEDVHAILNGTYMIHELHDEEDDDCFDEED